MSNVRKTTAEVKLAEEIVGVLPAGSVARVLSPEKDSICFRIRSASVKLHTVRFRRESLRRLSAEEDRDVKIEYIKRELLAAAEHRGEYHFPHAVRIAPLRSTELAPRRSRRVASV